LLEKVLSQSTKWMLSPRSFCIGKELSFYLSTEIVGTLAVDRKFEKHKSFFVFEK
jgi:hypothetical protein